MPAGGWPRLWSPQEKVSTWRRLWVALAEAQRALGLAISEEQIAALRGAGRRDRLRRRRRATSGGSATT